MLLRLAVVLLTVLLLYPQAQAAPDPWSAAPVLDAPEDFQFAIVSDRTGGHRDGVFEQALQKVNLLRPSFVMTVGDLIEGYDHDGPTIDAEWDEVTGAVGEHLDMRFYYVPGNHDIHWKETTGLVSKERWEARFGRTYYHFVYQNVLFLCLNTEDPPPSSIDLQQQAYFADVLAKHPDVRWTCLFMHKPMWAIPEARGWVAMETLLADRPYTVFAAHWHQYHHEVRKGHDYFVLGTCGGSSDLRGQAYGELDHLTWITMTEAGPAVALIALDGVHDQDYRVPMHRVWVSQLDETPILPPSVTVPVPVPGADGAVSLDLKVSNPLRVPVTLRVTPRGTPMFWPSPSPSPITLPAGARDVPLALPFLMRREGAGVPAGPLRLDYTVEVDAAGVPVFRHALQSRLHWAAPSPLPVRRVDSGTVTVDGDLGEWPAAGGHWSVEPAMLLGSVDGWAGPQDCSLRVDVAEDDAFLYVAVAVTDDRSTRNPGQPPDRQDGILLQIDARAVGRWAAPPEAADLDGYFVLSASPGEHGAEDVEAADKWPAGTQLSVVQRPGGFVCEAAIPHGALDSVQGATWRDVRVNVRVCDVDGAPMDPRVLYWWQPEWGSAGDDGRSGGFVRTSR